MIDSHIMYSISLSIGLPYFTYLSISPVCSLLLVSVTSSVWTLNFGPIDCTLIASMIWSSTYCLMHSRSSLCVVLEMYDAFCCTFLDFLQALGQQHLHKNSSRPLKFPFCLFSGAVESSQWPLSASPCLPQNSRHLIIEVLLLFSTILFPVVQRMNESFHDGCMYVEKNASIFFF